MLKEIRKTGAYSNKKPDSYQIDDPLERAKRWIEEYEEKLALMEKIEDESPKVTYYDTILQSKDTFTVSQIAKDYGLTANKLNKILHEQKVQYNKNDQWLLYKDYMNDGLTKSSTFPYVHKDGSLGCRMYTKWTRKGRLMIHSLLESIGIKANLDKKTEE